MTRKKPQGTRETSRSEAGPITTSASASAEALRLARVLTGLEEDGEEEPC